MKEVPFHYSRRRMFSGFDGKFCKTSPHIVTDGQGNVVLSYSMLLLTGSDVVYGKYLVHSTDGGASFGEPVKQEALADRWEGEVRQTFGGFPAYSRFHKRWFGIGSTAMYADDKEPICRGGIAVCRPLYLTMDQQTRNFTGCKPLPFPVDCVSVCYMSQFVELDNGDLLLPFYITTEDHPKGRCITVRYAFDGDELKIVAAGEPLEGPVHERGLCEPSLARLNGRFYMTIRTDEVGLYAVSEDGLHFSDPTPWVWEDGAVLENYNTQQHWVCHKDGLYLSYTRRGAHNDHVFRHRAPIFMARFDEDRGCLLRDSEVILVPELGARLGNFSVIEASETESWLTTAEWMQPAGCERYGSDNSLWWIKVFWE